MKKTLWRRILTGTVALALTLVGSLTLSLPVVATETMLPVVSYGVSVLSAKTDVAVSAVAGNDIVFSEDIFARSLNLSEVRYVTVTSLPPAGDGELLLGSSRVAVGQTVSAQNLSFLTFAPKSLDVAQSSFTFTANGSASPVTCNLYLLAKSNSSPTISVASDLSLHVSTYRGLSAYGTLSAYDPDGDEMTFEIVSYPQNGTVRLTDRTQGTYRYSPASGYVGNDSFTYVARDRYGNYSTSATVSLKVNLSGTAVTYADMLDSKEYNAALAMTEAGIMNGTQIGDQTFFEPDATVSRVDFLVMAMNAVGITDVPACSDTGFADDAKIPTGMKGYVAAAYAMQYISGTETENGLCFAADEILTRAEAAVILNHLVGDCAVKITPTFADFSDIPVWASDAIFSLNAAGIYPCDEQGCISPTAPLTRGQTARMLAAAMAYVR